MPLGDFFPVRERSQVLAQFRDSISSRMPEVGSAAFLKRLHSEIWKERNRYDGHCWEQVIGFCFVENCQSPCSWMELLGKRGSLRLLRSRRWAGGTHPEGEIPRQVTLRVRYLNRDHSQSSYQSYEESDPQKRCRIAQNGFAAFRGMAGMILTFQLPTFQHRQSRWSDVPVGLGANNNTFPG